MAAECNEIISNKMMNVCEGISTDFVMKNLQW